MNNFLSAILKLFLIGVVAVPIFFLYSMSTNSHKEMDTRTALIERAKKDKSLAISVTPTQISDLYDSNKFAVDEKYENKLVSISGVIANLTKVLSTPVIELDGEGSGLIAAIVEKRIYMDFDGNEAEVQSLFAKLSIGKRIRLLCFGAGGAHFRCYPNSVY